MEQQNINPRFPEQDEPEKFHGTTDDKKQQEKYIRDSGKIEDLPSQDSLDELHSPVNKNKNESAHLTDRSGEEKKEEYINTDERKRDLDRHGL